MKPFPPILLALSMVLVYLLAHAAQLGTGQLGVVYKHIAVFFIGWSLIAIGMTGIMGLIFKFRKNETPILPNATPRHLMMDGIYSYSRNPIYLFMVIALLGVVCVNGALISLTVVPVFMALVNNLWINFEETQLEKQFGKAYLDYKARVRKWI